MSSFSLKLYGKDMQNCGEQVEVPEASEFKNSASEKF
jgi:hypothetical protein